MTTLAAKPSIALRPMLPEDGPDLAAIFVDSIDALTGADYTPAQQTAWMGAADNEDAFINRLRGLLVLVATIGGERAGFAALKAPDHIEMLYVRPEATKQGVAAALCDALETIAQARGTTAMTVDASDTAQGFFASRGYEAQIRQTISLGDEWLGRTAMRKTLHRRDGTSH